MFRFGLEHGLVQSLCDVEISGHVLGRAAANLVSQFKEVFVEGGAVRNARSRPLPVCVVFTDPFSLLNPPVVGDKLQFLLISV